MSVEGSMQKCLYFVQRLMDFIIINGLGSLDEKCRPKQPTATPTICLLVSVDLGWASRDIIIIRNDSRA